MINHALEFTAAGISIIPLRCDGSKSPAVSSWKPFQQDIVNETTLQSWYQSQTAEIGTAIICGAVSGGLEVLDFDHDAQKIFPAWASKVDSILSRLIIVRTPSDGFHVYYRCNTICGNQKIANGADKETLIESRGEGGYVVTVISPPSVHHRNVPYVQIAGPLLPEVPGITADERKALWRAAASFDQSGIREQTIKKLSVQSNRTPRRQSGKLTPWDDFNSRGDWFDVLVRHHWTTKDGIHWRHPNAKSSNGHSATLRQSKSGDKVLHVFSTSSPLEAGVSHSLFNVLKVLEFGGDARATTIAIRREGYGN